MRTFDVQGIEIQASRAAVFAFVSDPRNLPKWAHAFQQADDKRASLKTPMGAVDIALRTSSHENTGTVDWQLTFPDGAVGEAQSRVTETARGSCIYYFVLHAPPVPLEQLEGALDAQSATLREELARLKQIVEGAMTETTSVEELARLAIAGDRNALERLVRSLQTDIFALAIRMVWNREDAEDATQEILIRVITRLSAFDFRSRLKTWAYRVAVNYLLDAKKSAVERMNLTFLRLTDDLLEGLAADGPAENERSVLIEEVKIGCTLAMLQCLDRPHRLAYILGEILDLTGPEAAEALNIDPALLRKRLERARSEVFTFTQSFCGLVSDEAACRCHRRVPAAIRLGRVRPDALDFADRAVSFEEVRTAVRRAEEARTALEVHRTSLPRGSSVGLAQRILDVIEAV